MSLDPKLQEPLEGPEPGGANLRYEPVYDQIKEARTEEDDIPQGDWQHERKTADWPVVVKLCTEILEKRSKDLQVAAWLTEGLLNREGFGGFRDGLDLMKGLLEKSWDHLYPEIDDGDLEFRAAPLEWVGNYLDLSLRRVPLTGDGYGYLEYRQSRDLGYEEEVESDPQRKEAREQGIRDGKLTPEDFDDSFAQTPKSFYKELVADLEGSVESLEALDGVSQELFGDVAPSFRRLRDGLNDVQKAASKLLERKLEAEPDPAPTEAAPEEAAPEEDVSDVEPPGESDGAGASGSAPSAAPRAAPPARLSNREQAAASVASAAAFLRAEDPTDPAPYLLLRGLRWGELRRGEDHVDPRLLDAPPTELRTKLKGLLLDAHYDELVEEAERVMAGPYGRGWLDLQRYVLTALEALGSEYEPAASAVRKALGELLEERPELLSSTLMDDSPTANPETMEWLASTGIVPSDEEGAERARSKPTPKPSGAAVSQRAADLVRAGRQRQAIELLMREADQENSPRARFLRRAEATRIMVDEGLESVAIPVLREMLDRIERHTLEEWEDGELVAAPLGLLWRCLVAVEGDSGQAQELYKRVCRLDPVAALHLTPDGSRDDAQAQETEAEAAPAAEGTDGEE